MRIGAETMTRLVIGIAVACVALGIATRAFAVPPNEALRIETNQTFTGRCCFSWGETVTVTEPKAVIPATVTFNTDYRATVNGFVGISVNGHPCMTTQGFSDFVPSDGAFRSANFEWVVFPSDGLIKGNNVITLCGGADADSGSVTLGFNTLAVRISK